MSLRRHNALLTLSTALILTAAAPILSSGCGSTEPDVDKAALYTPESLAQELALRFAALNPDVKKTKTTYKAKPLSAKAIATRERADQAKKQGQPAVTKKRSGPPTIDDLLADIDGKLNLLKGVSRGDACRKMVDAISQDKSLGEADKTTLTEFVNRLAEGS